MASYQNVSRKMLILRLQRYEKALERLAGGNAILMSHMIHDCPSGDELKARQELAKRVLDGQDPEEAALEIEEESFAEVEEELARLAKPRMRYITSEIERFSREIREAIGMKVADD